MAIAKGYWRTAKIQYHWDLYTSSCDGVLVDASNLNAHSRNFNYTFSVGSKINDGFNINGFITEAVSHPRSGSFSILKVYHDRNMNFLFDKDSKRFPRSADPLIGRVDLPHSDPWYERSIYHHNGLSGIDHRRWLTSSDGIGKAKFKYKIVKTTDDDGNVTERIKIKDMIFKEARPFTATQDFLFTDNILFQANPDL